MTALIITAAVILIILLLLFMPVCADISYFDELRVIVTYCGIRVFKSGGEIKSAHEKPEKEEKPGGKKPKKNSFISDIFKEKGKIEGIKFCFSLLKLAFSKIVWIIKKIKFKKLMLDISVAGEDAAKTAVSYGALCAVAYPVLSFLKLNTTFDIKKVKIYTDFDKLSPEIKGSAVIKLRLIYMLVALVSMFFAYLRLKKESDKNG